MDLYIASGWIWDDETCDSQKIKCGIFDSIELAVEGIDSTFKSYMKGQDEVIKKKEYYLLDDDSLIPYKLDLFVKGFEFHFKIEKEVLNSIITKKKYEK